MVRRAAAAVMLLVSVLLLHLALGHGGAFGDAEVGPGSSSIAGPAAGQQPLAGRDAGGDAGDERDGQEPCQTVNTPIVGASRVRHRRRHLPDGSPAAPATGVPAPRDLPLARCVDVTEAGNPPDLAMLQVLRC
ncbi:hypothetical protein [Streptomyces sp. NPDC058279]|uniref:hypothetical protein n=1 Tax=Streptomyces sp. NPDC058279 TaxID=3346418 RepID=UPI0036E75481